MLDDGKELTVRRAFRAAEFWLILVTAVAATFGVAWWVAVPLATLGLSISSLPKYFEMWPRAAARVRASSSAWCRAGCGFNGSCRTDASVRGWLRATPRI